MPVRAERSLEAQRRVAILVAGGACSADVFAAIAREVGHLIGLPLVAIWRFEPDDTATVVGEWGDAPHVFAVGTRWPLDGPTICARVRETASPARIDDFAGVAGTIADAARDTGIRACAGAPIVVDGELWGAMSIDSTDLDPLPDDLEQRLVEFTELLGASFSTTARQEKLTRLAEEQAALRRVATLVVTGVPAAELFAAVAEELGRLLPVATTALLRYESGDEATVVATWGDFGGHVLLGMRLPLAGHNVATLVHRTGRPARIDDYFSSASGSLGRSLRQTGIAAAVGCPVVADGRLWGVVIAAQRAREPLPADTEARVLQFTELMATAISNIQARADLAASRARIVAAADDERRRVVRDLHDGAQQRLVNMTLTVKLARELLRSEPETAPPLLDDVLEQCERAIVELRELAHGILPAVLTNGGLAAGLQALATRVPFGVELDVEVERLPPAVEATGYFVAAEALTNVSKHARATRVGVAARVECRALVLTVADDGVGGAQPFGTGLVGLRDRLAVLDGRLRVDSPPSGGTVLTATIPLGAAAD
jgi:signal transduction histidine kinase